MYSGSSSSLLSLGRRSSSFLILQGTPEAAIQFIEDETTEKLHISKYESNDFILFSNDQISLILENIEAFLKRKEADKAKPYITKLIEWKKTNFLNFSNFPSIEEEALFFLACAQMIDKEYQNAFDTLLSIEVKQPTKNMDIKARISRSFVLIQMNKVEQAMTILRPLMGKSEFNQTINEIYALCLLKCGKTEEAKELLLHNIISKKHIIKQDSNIQNDEDKQNFSSLSQKTPSSLSTSSRMSLKSNDDNKNSKIRLSPVIKKDFARLMLEILKKP